MTKKCYILRSFSSVCETNELEDQFNLLLLCSIPMEETKKVGACVMGRGCESLSLDPVLKPNARGNDEEVASL